MATCCSVTFVVFAAIAMGASIAALNLPMFIFVDGSFSADSSDADVATHRTLMQHTGQALGHGIHGNPADRKSFKEQSLPLGDGSFQCPFFNNQCDPSTVFDVTTDDFLRGAMCGDNIGSASDPAFPRLWSIVASPLSGATFGLGIFHMMRSSSPLRHTPMLKFIIAGTAGAHAAVSAYSAFLQSRITLCLTDSVVVELAFGGSTLIMVSMIAQSFAGGVMFFCAVGMALSWCVSCCGAPPGSYQGNNMYQQNVQVQMMNAYPADYTYGNLPPPAQNPQYAPGYPAPQQQYPQQYPPQQQGQQYAAPGKQIY